MAERPQAVAVTGAAGYVGSRLIRELAEEAGLAKVLAIDTKPLRRPVHNIKASRLDVSQPLDGLLHDERIDTVVHLAFSYPMLTDQRDAITDQLTNLETLQTILDSCRRARVSNFVYLSSHTVYGPHRESPVPITEDEPLQPLGDFPYALHKARSEELIARFASDTPQVGVTVLRACVVLGPTSGNRAASALFKPMLLGVWREDPPWQFIHEDDLAAVLALAVVQPQPGTYNVAGYGVVPYSEVARTTGAKLLKLNPSLAYTATHLSWKFGIQKEAPAGALDFVRYPMVMSTGRLRRETGFRPRYSSREALMEYVSGTLG